MGQTQTAFIMNDEAWAGKFPKCGNCFPLKVDAALPCAPSCLFTKEGKGGSPEIVEFIFKNKVPPQQKPKFIIAYGPSGSGKSRILEILPDIKKQNVIEVNVDKIFQTNDKFKKQMDDIQQHTTDPLYTQRLYQYYRWVADQIADGVLNEALTQKFHILWETTGNSIGWIEKEIARINSLGYETIVVFPLVSVEKLLDRVNKRAQEEKQVGASYKEISEQSNNAQRNLVAFLTKHKCPEWILQNVYATLESCNPARIIIFTNETDSAEMLYDSQDPSNQENLQRMRTNLQNLAVNESFIKYFQDR